MVAVKEGQNQQQSSYTVEQLVAFNPHNPDILPDLENYVNEQALMAMPTPDFSLCLFLIPERVQMEEPFKTLIILSNYLEFWDEAAKNRHLVEAVPGFEQAIQTYAVHVLSLTYQKVPRAVLAEAINIEGPSLDKFLENHFVNRGLSLENVQGEGQLIVIRPNEFNHPELKRNSAEAVPLEHICRIFPILGFV